MCHYNYSTAVDSSMVLIYKLEFKHRKKFQCMWDSGPPGTLSFYWGLFLQYGGATGLALSSANLRQEEVYEAIKFLCYMYFFPLNNQ